MLKHNLDVPTLSILPLQCGIEIVTPKGVGTYEGMTSSGIVKVFINGGISEFSTNEIIPIISLSHIDLIDKFKNKLIDYINDYKLNQRNIIKEIMQNNEDYNL